MDLTRTPSWPNEPQEAAAAIIAELRAQAEPPERPVVRRIAKALGEAEPAFVLDVARALLPRSRWLAYELVAGHRGAFACLRTVELEAFGHGIDDWSAVDAFARTLAGPAWLRGQVPDATIQRWAQSPDRWWRRAALVATVALNVRSHGGMGDTRRTLAVCRRLAHDRDDMVVKALSWALRALVAHDPDAVRGFLEEHDSVLAGRVKREARHKLATGLKHPRREQG
jgi:3-methyladenine DNA glycosylase AlkD